MSTSNNNQNKPPNKGNPLKQIAVLSGIGIQMGAIIFLFAKLGKWLDSEYNPGGKTFLIVCTLLGVAASLYVVVKQLNQIKY